MEIDVRARMATPVSQDGRSIGLDSLARHAHEPVIRDCSTMVASSAIGEPASLAMDQRAGLVSAAVSIPELAAAADHEWIETSAVLPPPVAHELYFASLSETNRFTHKEDCS